MIWAFADESQPLRSASATGASTGSATAVASRTSRGTGALVAAGDVGDEVLGRGPARTLHRAGCLQLAHHLELDSIQRRLQRLDLRDDVHQLAPIPRRPEVPAIPATRERISASSLTRVLEGCGIREFNQRPPTVSQREFPVWTGNSQRGAGALLRRAPVWREHPHGADSADRGIRLTQHNLSASCAYIADHGGGACRMEPRSLPERERTVLDALLSVEFEGAAALRDQAAQAEVVGMCGCGCPSIDFQQATVWG